MFSVVSNSFIINLFSLLLVWLHIYYPIVYVLLLYEIDRNSWAEEIRYNMDNNEKAETIRTNAEWKGGATKTFAFS